VAGVVSPCLMLIGVSAPRSSEVSADSLPLAVGPQSGRLADHTFWLIQLN
jgi:hypothetical protein